MAQVSPTRMNLLAHRAQIKLASQGADLLKSKRDALLKEFFALVKPLVDYRKKLQATMGTARTELAMARALLGGEQLESAALATHRKLTVDVEQKSVWGIHLPEVTAIDVRRELLDRGYSITGESARIDETSDVFENLLDLALRIAPIEIKVRRLGEEIRKTTRRVNALEDRLIPRLQEEVRHIRNTLEERAREDTFRLKRLKNKKEK